MQDETPRVPTHDIPQANRLSTLRTIVQAVAEGATTTVELERTAGLSPRHVNYYLVAARILGWLDPAHIAPPRLTTHGEALVATHPGGDAEADVIARAMANSAPLAAAVGAFLLDGSDVDALTARLRATTDLSPTTAERRATCLVAWKNQLAARGWTPARLQFAEPAEAPLPVDYLSVRAVAVLHRLGIDHVDDVARLSEASLRGVRNCGRATRLELLQWRDAMLLPGADASQPERIDRSVDGPLAPLPIALLLDVTDLDLSLRARQVVARLRAVRVGDLAIRPRSELIDLHNCGWHTVSELARHLQGLGLALGMSIPDWDRLDAAALVQERAPEIAELRRQRRHQRYPVDSSAGVEAEVASAIASVVKPRDQAKVARWIGLDQPSPPTLGELGEVVDLTRERVRQIVARAERKLSRAALEMPRLVAACQSLERAVMFSEPEACARLAARGLASGYVSPRGLLRAAKLFSVATSLAVERFEGIDFVCAEAGLTYLMAAIARCGRRAVERWGCATLDDVAAGLSNAGDAAVTADQARQVLTIVPGFSWLDESTGWFWLRDVPQNRVTRVIDKILAVSPRVDLAALRAGIARCSEGSAPPLRVLGALVHQLDDCRVVGDRVVEDARRRRHEALLSPHEQTILSVFRRFGPALSFTEARRRCLEAGIPAATSALHLSSSPILCRLAVGVYGVVGDVLGPGDVAAAAERRVRGPRTRVVQDYGLGADGGTAWVTYRLSDAMLRSGVLGVPVGLRRLLAQGRYTLRWAGVEVGPVSLGETGLSGFAPFFRRRGGDVGDRLRVTLELSGRVVLAEWSAESDAED